MTRLAPIPPESWTEEQHRLYEMITRGPRAQDSNLVLVGTDKSLLGPFNAFLLSPAVGMALQNVGVALRGSDALTAREREIATLLVASHWDSAFERRTHELSGRAAGLTETELNALRAGTIPELADARERGCACLTRALVHNDISDSDWNAWIPSLGIEVIFELSTLVGYYGTLALQMRIFRVD